MELKHTTYSAMKLLSIEGKEAFICMGVDKPDEWIRGITHTLHENGCLALSAEFKEVYTWETTGGRRELAFMFVPELHIGKLSMWRLRFGDCSWLSDYVVNYEKQNTVTDLGQGWDCKDGDTDLDLDEELEPYK